MKKSLCGIVLCMKMEGISVPFKMREILFHLEIYV